MDFPRALQAGFVGGFFAVYTSNPPEVPSAEARTVLTDEGFRVIIPPALLYNYAHQSVLKMIDLMQKIEEESQGRLKIVTNYQELEACLENHVMAVVLHLEGAEPILPNLENLDFFYQKGIRSLGITWSRPNAFGSGVPFAYPSSPDTGPGLTDAGKKLVAKCYDMGVILDLAHLNEKGFWDVAELSSAPLISTHSAAWGIVPKARNLTDDQLKAIRDSNGVAGIIFSVNDIDGGKRPKYDAPITTIIDHICYLADLIGPEHVAFGSDFDGTEIPSELGDISNFPVLVDLLEKAGFSTREREMISYQNWLRVLRDTWSA